MKVRLREEYLESDAVGYDVGEFIYHITPKKNVSQIRKNGFVPKDGVSINNIPYKNRLYFATSLIASYDLSVNFKSYKSKENYVIFKLTSNCLDDKGYEYDPLFRHGIYVDYSIPYSYVIDIVNTDNLFGKFDENDLDDLYD